jgi:hypothetical protein
MPVRLLAAWIYDLAAHRPFDLDAGMLTLYLRLSLLKSLSWLGHVEWLVGLALVLVGLSLRLQTNPRPSTNK